MSKLIVYDKNGTMLGQYPLVRERVTIGRKPQNLIRLEHATVSGEHALIITVRNDSFLEDLQSTNGTRVNGKVVKKCLLQDGDEIKIARYTLKYVHESGVTADTAWAGGQSESGMGDAGTDAPTVLEIGATREQGVTRQYADTQQMTPAEAAHEQKGKAPSLAAIQILSRPGSGQQLELSKKLTTLGKPGVQVAIITRRSHGYYLTHVEGVEFPLVNGTAITAQPYLLQDHDIVELAGTKLEFFFK